MCNQDSYYFLSNIQDHFCSLTISVFAQCDNDTAKVNNSFQTFLTCAEIFLFSQGMNVKSKVPILLEVLDNYDLQNLVEFFDAAQTGAENQQLCHHPSSQKKRTNFLCSYYPLPKAAATGFLVYVKINFTVQHMCLVQSSQKIEQQNLS